MSGFKERLENIRARMSLAAEACGRDPDSVSLLAVSKFHPAEALRDAMECGITHFAENYVQEGMSKSALLPNATFALIGPLQRNKAKPALLYFRELLTVDRPELALRLVKLAEELDICREIWIQVDLWGEVSKIGGCQPSDVQSVLDAFGASSALPLKGFMAIPPPGMTSAFSELANFRENWRQRLGTQIQLSMGMSDDLEEAIKAGSDQVRVGTALFGERY
ncbi:MAG: YggS family pyridoxal phosphate-dependent enzyme [Holophagales bacterium]|jgi:pyridoxal phosphate enzyme (YggS family)|nr:YggS family pyridoxal phosphate-dependent enzyme [Holophagales bacterium]